MPDLSSHRLLVWRSGGMRCAAPIESLREVLPWLPVARLPGVPPAVCGVANVRGQLVTVVDGRRLIGAAHETTPGATVLVRLGSRTVGLAVDDVEDMVTVEDDAFAPAPDGSARRTVRVDDDAPAHVLDLDGLLGSLFPQ
jgi:chemotaxis signal transduction protein